ncbi:neuropeptide CCHamide-2 [Bacillus rossius redtenbacheri]|uniref:neuropeptide CCHamide-2 n=1 Tax=Bacillus rossius redtenbacheri TaxID=93214 RepID=UPI002FDCB87F
MAAPVALCVATALLALLAGVHEAQAKRGCSSFGHSCFGGHGKRSDEAMLAAGPPMPQQGPGEDEQVYLGSGRDGGNDFSRQPGLRVPPFLRQWLESYRRSSGIEERK